jgi:kynurenine formamidase
MTATSGQTTLAALAAQVSNWGRWGVDDQVGTPNLITPQRVADAARLATRGEVFSLAIPFDAHGPQEGVAGRFNPIRTMLACGTDWAAGAQTGPEMPPEFGYADDVVSMPLQCATHWDGLAHVFHEGQMYNGRAATLVTAQGAQENGIEHLAGRVATRGVLLDVPRWRGVDGMEPGEAVRGDELQDIADAQGVAVGPGDALLIRTGYMSRFIAEGDWHGYTVGTCPGLSYEATWWLRDHDVAAVASDTFRVEVVPFELDGVRSPFHLLAIVHMGLLLGEIFQLDALAEACARYRTYEFLFVAGPLPFTHAVGAPVNPYAIL